MIRFIDVLGRVFTRSRIREICAAADLNETETKLIILRCCDTEPVDIIADVHGITLRKQRVLVPQLCDQLRLWVNRVADTGSDELTKKELAAINALLAKHNLPPATDEPTIDE